MTRPKPVNPPANQPWGNITLSFRDVDGGEVAAFTIDPGQQIGARRFRTANDRSQGHDQDPMVQGVPETAVSFVLDWNLTGGA